MHSRPIAIDPRVIVTQAVFTEHTALLDSSEFVHDMLEAWQSFLSWTSTHSEPESDALSGMSATISSLRVSLSCYSREPGLYTHCLLLFLPIRRALGLRCEADELDIRKWCLFAQLTPLTLAMQNRAQLIPLEWSRAA
jgi:hypothetical protein